MSMNVLDAARNLARSLPGGVEAIAHRLGKRPDTLRHELIAQGFAKLGLEDADAIGALAREARSPNRTMIVNALAATVGGVVVLLPDSDAMDGDTFAALAQTAREFGEFITSVAEAAADGKVTANELKRVDKELGDMISRAQGMRQRLAAMHEEGRPSTERGGA